MDILIESTSDFEKDLERLDDCEKAAAISKINDCASLVSNRKPGGYHQLHPPLLALELNGYESSLYTLKVSEALNVILSVDEDPIFSQTIFTLFHVVDNKDLEQSYRELSTSLYQDLLQEKRKPTLVS